MENKVRTRYAPSPTGFMHIGNLRTALYEYLISKSLGGKFILRIEDTDQCRHIEGAQEVIYSTLKQVGLTYDEGPDIGGNFGPYVQSQRKDIYLKYAQRLIEEKKAYHCFCDKERLESLKSSENCLGYGGYDRHCRYCDNSLMDSMLKSGKPYVIRQKMPLDGSTEFTDEVYGEIIVENKELQDQILIKADGLPTYNFANVIDDHLMGITHIVRGCEYLSSAPKYNLLYEAFGWEIPKYIHLPLIMGKNEDGSLSKLSKRHGSVSFEDLVREGYLPEAIVNCIALLGWCPSDNREIFSLSDLVKKFSIDRISKSPSTFDYDKLNWFNGEYIRSKEDDHLLCLFTPYIKKAVSRSNIDYLKIVQTIKNRVTKLTQIPDMIDFIETLPKYDINLFVNKKSKTNLENSLLVLKKAKERLLSLNTWCHESIYDLLIDMAKEMQIKNGTLMWPIRVAVSGKLVTPGGAVEILDILGKDESINRINLAIEILTKFEEKNL
ncbi:MAG: glutamate--tRNA ligase [Oscillospiraceae bacterium]|jgi:glutamyl-tRNA synthetase|nr:glutamate--tRNA ligase [Oscillospiraceae bacterium]